MNAKGLRERRRLRKQNKSLRQRVKALTTGTEAITAPLTPARLGTEERAAERLKYGDQEKQITGQLNVAKAQQGRISDWYGQYKQSLATALHAQQTAQQDANTQILALQQGTQQQAAPQPAAGQAPVAPEAAQAAQQAAAARAASVGSFGAMLATQGVSRDAYTADQGRIATGDEIQQHVNEHARANALREDRTNLAKEKGAFRIQYRADARETERKNALENAAFGLDQQKAASDAALSAAAQASLNADRKADNKRQKQADARSRMESDRRYRLDLRKFGAAKAKDNYQKTHALGPYKKPAKPGAGSAAKDKNALSPAELRASRTASNKAITKVQTIAAKMGDLGGAPYTDTRGTPDTKDDVVRKPTRDEIFAELRKKGASQDEIIVALAIRHGDKEWDARTTAAAKRLGIRIPKSHRRKKPTGAGAYPTVSGSTMGPR